MTNETENLVLEHLKALRKQMTEFETKVDKRFDDVDRRFAVVSQRLDMMQNRIDASQYILTSTLSSILVDHTDLKERITALETART